MVKKTNKSDASEHFGVRLPAEDRQKFEQIGELLSKQYKIKFNKTQILKILINDKFDELISSNESSVS